MRAQRNDGDRAGASEKHRVWFGGLEGRVRPAFERSSSICFDHRTKPLIELPQAPRDGVPAVDASRLQVARRPKSGSTTARFGEAATDAELEALLRTALL